MPPLVGCKSLGSQTNLRGHPEFKLVVCDFQECKELPNHDLYVAFVDQRI